MNAENGKIEDSPDLDLSEPKLNPKYIGPWQPRDILNLQNNLAQSAELFELPVAVGFVF